MAFYENNSKLVLLPFFNCQKWPKMIMLGTLNSLTKVKISQTAACTVLSKVVCLGCGMGGWDTNPDLKNEMKTLNSEKKKGLYTDEGSIG